MRALPGGKHAQFGVVVAQLVVFVLEPPQHVFRVAHKPVSYTHLTLPTIYSV